jgi:hypothetical protein
MFFSVRLSAAADDRTFILRLFDDGFSLQEEEEVSQPLPLDEQTLRRDLRSFVDATPFATDSSDAKVLVVQNARFFLRNSENDDLSASVLCECLNEWLQHRSPRDFVEALSCKRWPTENAFFRSKFPHEFLESHFASLSPPYVGRTYVSRHRVYFSGSVLWSSFEKEAAFQMLHNDDLKQDGRTVTFGADFSVQVVLADECFKCAHRCLERFMSTRTFGRPLAELQARGNHHVPLFVRNCVEFLDGRLLEEGLFRVPGSASTVRKWQTIVDEGYALRFNEETSHHDVASLLKKFLMDAHLFSREFIDVMKKASAGDDFTQQLRASQPAEWRMFMSFMLSFLRRVEAQNAHNKMTFQNLGICFAPIFATLVDVQDINDVMKILLQMLAMKEFPVE